MKLNSLKFWGIALGIAGFVLPFVVTFSGLSVAGHYALAIFFLAAMLWLTEAIEIHATSIGIIVLGALFLSTQGPVYSGAELATVTPELTPDSTWSLPNTVLTAENNVYLLEKDRQVQKSVEVLSVGKEQVFIKKMSLDASSVVIKSAKDKLVGYKPVSYSAFFNALANPIIILFLGGFMLADAAVKFKIDQALTRSLLKPFGKRPFMVLSGLMLVTGTLSAFMSNTATTAMMITVVMPVVAALQPGDRFKTALVLAIPTAANIGGIATPIGTPPNAVAMGALTAKGVSISFLSWMQIAGPIALIMLIFSAVLLYMMFKPSTKSIELVLAEPPRMTAHAWVTYITFGGTVLLWVTESLHGINSNLVASIPLAVFTATGVVRIKDIRNLPWEVLWLVAGGLALGDIMDKTGLMSWMIGLVDWSLFDKTTLILVFAVVGLLMSEFLSNTVIATLLIPIGMNLGLAALNVEGGGLNAAAISFLVMTAATIGLSVSLAMALPISTPPQAIAMSTGLITSKEMLRVGLIIGLAGLVVIVLFSMTYWPLII